MLEKIYLYLILIQLMEDKNMNITQDVRKILPLIRRKYSVEKIGIFGSYSRGEERTDSDIDVLVEFRETSFNNYMGLLHYLEERYDRKIDLVTVAALHERLRPTILAEVKWCET